MPDIPADLRYSKDHLWTRPGTGTGLVRVGVTDFAQQSLGDVVEVTLPRPGDTVNTGEACGDIESVKNVSDFRVIQLTPPATRRQRRSAPGLIHAVAAGGHRTPHTEPRRR